MPGSVDAVRSLVELAVARGVQRLVLLSGRGEDEAERAEEVVQAAGVDWTIVRSSWFNQNFSENYLLDAVLSGEVILPAGDVAEPFVDADDIADVVIAGLTEDGHAGQLYEVTAPAADLCRGGSGDCRGDRPGDPLRAGLPRAVRRGAGRGGRAGGLHLVGDLSVHHHPGWAQRAGEGRRAAGLGAGAPRFLRLCAGDRSTGVWSAPAMVGAR